MRRVTLQEFQDSRRFVADVRELSYCGDEESGPCFEYVGFDLYCLFTVDGKFDVEINGDSWNSKGYDVCLSLDDAERKLWKYGQDILAEPYECAYPSKRRTSMSTLEEFRATRTWSDDVHRDVGEEDYETVTPGFVYAYGGVKYYLECVGNRFCVTVSNFTESFTSLDFAEKALYEQVS